MASNVLFIGDNPSLFYYSWVLHQNNINNHLNLYSLDNSSSTKGFINKSDNSKGITFFSNNRKHSYHPNHVLRSYQEIDFNIDVVFLSILSLQNLSTICSEIYSFLNDNSIIIIESTGFIQLESYIEQNLQQLLGETVFLDKNITILSIMLDSDIKKINKLPIYLHQKKTSTDYIYIGNSLNKSNKYSRNEILAINKLTNYMENTSINVEILKIDNSLEFLNYQWKFALPRIVFNPLLIIFELDCPIKISKEILAKPLISGLLNELLILLKKMNCKLIKGYENENSLLNTWSKLYPEKNSNDDDYLNESLIEFGIINNNERISLTNYLNSPNLFFEFYNNYKLDFDPLLLQPILLADDYSIKTPYLEFLYTTICQYDKLNQSNSANQSSIFFIRNSNQLKEKVDKSILLETNLKTLNNQKKSLEDSNQNLIKQINDLSLQLNSQRLQNNKLQQQLQRQSVNNPSTLNTTNTTSSNNSSSSNGSRRQSIVNSSGHLPILNNNNINSSPQRSPARNSIHNITVNNNQNNENKDSNEDFADLVELSFSNGNVNGNGNFNGNGNRSRTPSPGGRNTFTNNINNNQQQQQIQPSRSESFNNLRKSGVPMNSNKHQRSTIKRVNSTQSNAMMIPPLEAQASFVSQPYGNNSSFLPKNDVSSRFTPQSRKNRKSGMPMLGNRIPSGNSIANLNNNVPPPPSNNPTGQDIDEYSLYGGENLPALQKRNRASSYKNLVNLNNQRNFSGVPPSPSNGFGNNISSVVNNGPSAKGNNHQMNGFSQPNPNPPPLPNNIPPPLPVVNAQPSTPTSSSAHDNLSISNGSVPYQSNRLHQPVNNNSSSNLLNNSSSTNVSTNGTATTTINTSTTTNTNVTNNTTTTNGEVSRTLSISSKKKKKMKSFFGKKKNNN